MGNMEFLKQNLLDTTASFRVSAGQTGTLAYLYDRNIKLDFTTVGYSSNTSTVISFEFSTPKVVSRILLQNHNLKQFRLFYNSATANTFTPDLNVAQNSATSTWYSIASVTVSSIQLQLDAPITADTEKSVGEWIVTERQVSFTVNPSAQNYQPKIAKTRIKHTMPDGGTAIMNVANKFKASIKFKFLDTTTTNQLEDMWDTDLPAYFTPFPTATAWDGKAYETVWTNDYNLFYAEDSKSQGYNGDMTVEETPSA